MTNLFPMVRRVIDSSVFGMPGVVTTSVVRGPSVVTICLSPMCVILVGLSVAVKQNCNAVVLCMVEECVGK